MQLEGRPAGWFTSNTELLLNGRSLGSVRTRWFSEGLDLDLGGNRVRFEKASWLRSHFVLKDADGNEIGSAKLGGFLGLRWDLELKSGSGTLTRAGWFTHGFVVRQGASIVARINQSGWFTRAWSLVADEALSAEDVLLIGLVYTTIRHRETRNSSGHSS